VETVGVIVTMLFAAQPITDRMPPPSNALHRAGRRWPGRRRRCRRLLFIEQGACRTLEAARVW